MQANSFPIDIETGANNDPSTCGLLVGAKGTPPQHRTVPSADQAQFDV
jgi:hypothetical protein